ncbi:MAG TPA: PP2C family serine/threonine-protein phosphatase [Kiritimatiellia bacterium]|nr:PP2C family serine/threonine-protein phosphatase [Kiritimatiellia bacterium]
MNALETSGIKKPRSGSDYALHHTALNGAERRGVIAAIDTIGQSATGPMKKFISAFDRELGEIISNGRAGTLDELDAAVTELLLRSNSALLPLNRDRRDIFGFCITLCLMHGSECRVMQLGDCRAYLLEHRPDRAPAATMLTRDQNSLAMVMAVEKEYTFLSNELLELSRTLHGYWGKPDTENVRAALENSKRTVELPEPCCVFAATDGIFLPLIRGLLDLNNYRLTEEQFSLEAWLVNFLDTGGHLLHPGQWQHLVPDMIHLAEQYSAKKPRYRDDIAAATAWIE